LEEEKVRSEETMKEANKKISVMNDKILECKSSLEELARREINHLEMLKKMESEMMRMEEERNKLA
jgi:hypothetical protein